MTNFRGTSGPIPTVEQSTPCPIEKFALDHICPLADKTVWRAGNIGGRSNVEIRRPLEIAKSTNFMTANLGLLESLGEEGFMTRGSHAPLSSNEEITLRRVALGITKPEKLPKGDVERLKALLLIEEHEGGLRLCPLGRERYLALPKGSGIPPADVPDDLVSKLSEFMNIARR